MPIATRPLCEVYSNHSRLHVCNLVHVATPAAKKRSNCLGQPRCPGNTHFVAVKEWPLKGLKILTQCCLLSVKFVQRWAAIVWDCTCASSVSEKVVEPKPDQPDRLLRPCHRWFIANMRQLTSSVSSDKFFVFTATVWTYSLPQFFPRIWVPAAW